MQSLVTDLGSRSVAHRRRLSSEGPLVDQMRVQSTFKPLQNVLGQHRRKLEAVPGAARHKRAVLEPGVDGDQKVAVGRVGVPAHPRERHGQSRQIRIELPQLVLQLGLVFQWNRTILAAR